MIKNSWISVTGLFIVLCLAGCAANKTMAPPQGQPTLAATPATTTPAATAISAPKAPPVKETPAKMGVITATIPAATANPSGFTLTSPVVQEGGALPEEYTCDGASNTLALAWKNAPAGTQSFAVVMHHVASPADIHWYWVVYDIPADVTSLPKNVSATGTLGTNSVDSKQAYTPPCSKGPGAKTYTFTVYALSAQPRFTVPANKVSRAVLLEAIRDITLASAELNVTYSRK